jgi:hypothetical protein
MRDTNNKTIGSGIVIDEFGIAVGLADPAAGICPHFF